MTCDAIELGRVITSTTCFTVIFSLPFVRLDKIKQYESKSGSLNEEQITLIASKVSIEKSSYDNGLR
jgi:hypothetical protein